MPDTEAETSRNPRIYNFVGGDLQNAFAEDVRRGLASDPKSLPPKYFYDKLGSQLFEAICLLPEYYLTRAENEIFARFADEIVGEAISLTGAEEVTLMEMGSGSAQKTRLIIESFMERGNGLHYIPVDISLAALEQSAQQLLEAYPSSKLRVTAYASDYESALRHLGARRAERQKTLALFLGSNIGNFNRVGAESFLSSLRSVLREGDCLLLGADLKKKREVLEAAYDDSIGLTAAFNLNLLSRINRELDANFYVRHFRHVALYNEAEGRIEIYLESRGAQRISINRLNAEFDFAAGERIHTENSYKYAAAELALLAARTGFEAKRVWLDEQKQFSSNLFVAT